MVKSATTVLTVDSVEQGIKFYSDRLAFDIIDLQVSSSAPVLGYAQLKKGKCSIVLRTPDQDELVEFSQIKHSKTRGAGIYMVMKKGLDKYYERCKKKNVQIELALQDRPWGHRTFQVRDPFGFKLVFAQPIDGFKKPYPYNFAGLTIDATKDEASLLGEMCIHLKTYRISRRASKKYAKLFLKNLKKS